MQLSFLYSACLIIFIFIFLMNIIICHYKGTAIYFREGIVWGFLFFFFLIIFNFIYLSFLTLFSQEIYPKKFMKMVTSLGTDHLTCRGEEGRVWFVFCFFSFRIFFSDNNSNFFFCRAKRKFFFQNLTFYFFFWKKPIPLPLSS